MLKLTTKLVTCYHRELATDEWLAKLRASLTNAMEAHSEYRSKNGDGLVFSSFNEEHFMGPRSLIKNDFIAEISISRLRSTAKDYYKASVRYSPEADEFRILREEVVTAETQERNRSNLVCIAEVVKQIRSGCTRQQVDTWRCPWCDEGIEINFKGSGTAFGLSCPKGHFSRTVEIASPPDWWEEFITDDWLDLD